MWFILYRWLAVGMRSGVAKIRRIGWELLKKLLGPKISPTSQLWYSQQLTFPLLNSILEFIPWRVSGLGNISTVKGRSSLSKGGFEWMYIGMMNPSPIQSLFPHSGSRRVKADLYLKLREEDWKSLLEDSRRDKGKGYWHWNSPNEKVPVAHLTEKCTISKPHSCSQRVLAVFSPTYLWAENVKVKVQNK